MAQDLRKKYSSTFVASSSQAQVRFEMRWCLQWELSSKWCHSFRQESRVKKRRPRTGDGQAALARAPGRLRLACPPAAAGARREVHAHNWRGGSGPPLPPCRRHYSSVLEVIAKAELRWQDVRACVCQTKGHWRSGPASYNSPPLPPPHPQSHNTTTTPFTPHHTQTLGGADRSLLLNWVLSTSLFWGRRSWGGGGAAWVRHATPAHPPGTAATTMPSGQPHGLDSPPRTAR